MNTSPPAFRGLTLQQISGLLEEISATADELVGFANFAAERAKGDTVYDVRVMQAMAERIVALANRTHEEKCALEAGRRLTNATAVLRATKR